MNALSIDPTEYTPKVLFDPGSGTFELTGESRPEDVRSFYNPILEWLDEFRAHLSSNKVEGKKYEVKISLEYFNSTSAKYILDLITKLDGFVSDGHDFQIDWHYEELDEDMKDTGEEFSKLTEVPFKFTQI